MRVWPTPALLLLAAALVLAACAAPSQTAAPTTAMNVSTAVPTDAPEAPTPAECVEITVYFFDEGRYIAGTPPFEAAVTRSVPVGSDLPEAALAAYFCGPTEAEKAQGLRALTSGFTGYSALEVSDGIARVYLTGPCESNGATYTVAIPLMKTLRQFDGIDWVKIYDANGETGEPMGESSSIPSCLEP